MIPKLIVTLAGVLMLMACNESNQAPAPVVPDPDFKAGVWIDPALVGDNHQDTKVVVWFDQQLIDFDETYTDQIGQYALGRRALRDQLRTELKDLGEASMAGAASEIAALEDSGLIADLTPLWIVNGFTCNINPGGLSALSHVVGVHSIFEALVSTTVLVENGPRVTSTSSIDFEYDPNSDITSWNLDAIGAPRVWQELGITGRGVKNIIHDTGFTLELGVIAKSVYINPGEIPDNGIDDDENGYIDDYHGFNFEHGNGQINTGFSGSRGVIHGNSVAALIAGRRNGSNVYGVAPSSKWAGVLALSTFAEAVQWAVEQDFDTYTMSFSIPDLNHMRSHWRKVSEHAALCGLFLISGAGNFGDPTRSNFASVPKQMRTPEDIPEAVFAVSGLNRNGNIPDFSSKGPVKWETEHYKDGEIVKPDFATYNADISTIDNRGRDDVPVAGNSFAGPHLAGVIALILEANPDLKVWEVREILRQSAKDIEQSGKDVKTGYGLVNAYEAVKLAQ